MTEQPAAAWHDRLDAHLVSARPPWHEGVRPLRTQRSRITDAPCHDDAIVAP